MEIRRHCNERLPGGERLWRKAARIAGFDGTIEVIGLGQRRWNYREIRSKDKTWGITAGRYFGRRNLIQVFVNSSSCARGKWKKHDPFSTLCHELGHHRQNFQGTWEGRTFQTMKQWRADSQERSADAYGGWLRGLLREN